MPRDMALAYLALSLYLALYPPLLWRKRHLPTYLALYVALRYLFTLLAKKAARRLVTPPDGATHGRQREDGLPHYHAIAQ